MEFPAASTTLLVTVTVTALATTTLLLVGKTTLWPRREKILPSPLKTTLPHLPAESLKALVYQPDQFPGARDVDTPYGRIRAYEFGPEDGDKVLFVHGISTSCVTLSPIAHGLVERGHRVLLYDLFGRGFTDGVGDLPHDERLYVTQMLLVLASSDLSWTGKSARLKVVGYSLGGGIAVQFAAAFPNLVDSLVLLAPAGLIRAELFGAVTQFAFKSGFVPETLVAWLTSKRLQQPIARKKKVPQIKEVEVAAAEAADPPEGVRATPLEHKVLHYVRWMVEHHRGFVPAFMSCIRYAPLTEQHEVWAKLGERKKGATVVLLAKGDEIIDEADYTKTGLPLIGGEDKVFWRVLPGGHDFVMTHADDCLKTLDEAWTETS
ncbi:uncharacterized protein J7T54_006046 [Emericellopsis cladophorae]|uniref:Serine aminopeptidase S33 domain-containing protein n=1 Tax=Emericellopsis cladophorae TaxID=2686198 RepID=A0A9Q0BHM7_9HYPO|nr:uncharacterized protein J7T54_006046 [Emericellopsis cladophorae]KAI6785707.1 hypothetical protein J7T54_006046 [Emericellopsis cladophorae]